MEEVALSWALVFAGCSYCLCNCFQHLIVSPAVAGLCCREFEKNQLNEQIQKNQEQPDTAQNVRGLSLMHMNICFISEVQFVIVLLDSGGKYCPRVY